MQRQNCQVKVQYNEARWMNMLLSNKTRHHQMLVSTSRVACWLEFCIADVNRLSWISRFVRCPPGKRIYIILDR
jgi:hypothetical protein